MSGPNARPGVMRLAPYVQGQSAIVGISDPIKLSSNESSQGPSPHALKAYHDAAVHLNRYADGSQSELRNAIGEVHNLDPQRIICGNGSDELIQLMARAYVGDGHEALLSENGFIMSNIHCIAQGAKLVIAPEKNYKIDVDALLERVTDKTRFCTIANPNNPTGTYINGEELRRLHAGLPDTCLFLIDDAYAEYVSG
jgi:histidinol-phosphate aminotransferase